VLPRGGRAADDRTRGGGGAERVMRCVLEVDDSSGGGGADDARQAGGGRPDDTTRGWAHNVGDGSWSSEIGGAPSSMTGTAGPATVPAPGGVDDANDVRMAGSDDGDGGEAADQAQ